MIEITLSIFLLALSLFVLTKSADYFTDSAERIGLWLKLSPFIVGVTVVSLGTSLPELFASVFAVIKGNSEIVIGNVVGSNITNILLILGASAIVTKEIKVKESFIRIDLMVFITSAFILFLISLNGVITISEIAVLLVCLVIYLLYITKSKKSLAKKELEPIGMKREPPRKSVYFLLVLSLVMLFLSARLTVDLIVHISSQLMIGAEIIAATFVALGTSLPELAVSINAARKGKSDIAVGNILGSNIFNIFIVVGIAGLFGQIIVPENMIQVGSLFMIVSTFLYYFAVKDRVFSAWDGAFLVALYVLYILQIVGLA